MAQLVKNPCANAGDIREEGSIPGLGRSPGVREQLPSPVLWPGEFHGHGSLVGYSPWGCKESNTTERLTPNILTIIVGIE